MSMRRKIAGLTPEQIRQLATEEVDLPVSNKDFNEAMSRCNKSVSRADLDKYEKWMKEFGSSWWRCPREWLAIVGIYFWIALNTRLSH